MYIFKDNFKRTITLTFLVCISSIVFSQNTKVNATITYTYELPKLSYKHDYTLIVKDNISKYMYHQEKESYKSPNGILFERKKTYFDWYFDAHDKKIVEQMVLGDGTKLLAKWKANLQWKISDETQEINGYKVQKAITKSHSLGDFTNGDVIAWFATEIPINSGPERYYGLPGLIIKLEYTESLQVVILKDIVFDNVDAIKIPTDGIPISKEETLRYDLRTQKWLKKKKQMAKQ